jgi:hypothetical protein
MLTYRPDDYPGNQLTFSYTVGPTDPQSYGDWLDLSSPSIVGVTYNVEGLADPEGLDSYLFGLIGYASAATPPVTPDGGTVDGATNLANAQQQLHVVISASEYEDRRLFVTPRWCYLSLIPFGGNTNTATVTVSVVT